MKNPKRHVDCGKLDELEPILKNWCNLNKTYLNKSEMDCPWRYNERALISILAAAAWKSGHLALEEFSTMKGRKKDGTHGPGRSDLKIHIENRTFLFEVKKSRPKLGKKPREIDLKNVVSKSILGCLNRARGDAGKLKTKAGRRFGLCFVAPRISEIEETKLDDRLDGLIAQIQKKAHRYDSISWFFAKDWSRLKYNKHIYPGVFLLIKEAKKYRGAKKKSSR